MPLPLWGFFAGALLGVTVGLLVPDLMTALGGVIALGPIGALLGWGIQRTRSRR